MKSGSLIEEYSELHKRRHYGASSLRTAHYIMPHIVESNPKSVIDYGCGQSKLVDFIAYCGIETVYRYDPAIEAFSVKPNCKCDLLLSIDVLEHIPEYELDSILEDIKSISSNAIFVIDIKEAKTILPNGMNAHVTVKPASWWMQFLRRHYNYIEEIKGNNRPRAAFKTWPSTFRTKFSIHLDRARFRLKKTLFKRQLLP